MNIPAFIQKVRSRLKSSGQMDPGRDWLVLGALAIVLLAGIIVWNVWAFDTVAKGGTIGVPAVSGAPVFSRSDIDAINAIFASRNEDESRYQVGVYRYIDPSQ